MTTGIKRTPFRSRWGWGTLPAVLTVLILFIVPTVILTIRAFTEPAVGFENFARLFVNKGYYLTILRTLWMSGLATFIALLIGYPIAFVMVHGSAPVRRFLMIAIVAPYLTSILLRSFAWLVILGQNGVLNGLLGKAGVGPIPMMFTPIAVVIGLAHFLLPLMVLPLAATMRSINTAGLRAARSLGAPPAQAFVRTYLPLTVPGIQAGVVLSFVYGVATFVIPALLGGTEGKMIANIVYSAIDQSGDYGLAAASALVLAIIVIAVLAVFQRLTGLSTAQLAGRETVTLETVSKQRSRAEKYRLGIGVSTLNLIARFLDRAGVSRIPRLQQCVSIVFGVLVLAPQIVVIPVSFAATRSLVFPPVGWSTRWYEDFFTAQWLGPLTVSVKVGLVVMLTSAIIGTLAALGVVRGVSKRVGSFTSTLMMVPLLFPLVVSAAGYYIVFSRLGLVDTELGLILAHIPITLPFVFAVVLAGVQSLNPVYEKAAASLGANGWLQFRRIVLPILTPSIVTGALFAFITSFDEATISIFLSGVRVKTLPRRVYEGIAFETDPTIAVIGVLVMGVGLLAIIAWGLIRTLVRRKRA